MIPADVRVCDCGCHPAPSIHIHEATCCTTSERPGIDLAPVFSDIEDQPSRRVPVAEQMLLLEEIIQAHDASLAARKHFVDLVLDGMEIAGLTGRQIGRATGMTDGAIYQIRRRRGVARTYLKH